MGARQRDIQTPECILSRNQEPADSDSSMMTMMAMMIAPLFGLDGMPFLPPRKQFVSLRAKLGKQKRCLTVAGR